MKPQTPRTIVWYWGEERTWFTVPGFDGWVTNGLVGLYVGDANRYRPVDRVFKADEFGSLLTAPRVPASEDVAYRMPFSPNEKDTRTDCVSCNGEGSCQCANCNDEHGCKTCYGEGKTGKAPAGRQAGQRVYRTAGGAGELLDDELALFLDGLTTVRLGADDNTAEVAIGGLDGDGDLVAIVMSRRGGPDTAEKPGVTP